MIAAVVVDEMRDVVGDDEVVVGAVPAGPSMTSSARAGILAVSARSARP